MTSPSHILITGASSGIGEALALEYARPGLTLSLTGRDARRLTDVVAACRAKGAAAEGVVIDVTDRDAMARWIAARDHVAPLDMVVANAGISGGTSGVEDDAGAQAREIFAINLDGVMNTVMPAVGPMRARKRGHVALMSSLASFRGMGGAPAYSASKAAVRVWGEGLQSVLARDGVAVSVICPGFVVSRMTAVNTFKMPFLMDTPRAARIIRKGLEAGRGRIAFPWPTYAAVWLLAMLPDRLATLLTRNVPIKD